MADEFATAVTFLEVKDQKYKAQLKADEALTEAAAADMQTSLNTISIDAGKATAGVSALGGAAAVTGNVAVGAAAQFGTLISSLAPLGPLAIAAGVAIGGITLMWKLFASAQEKANETMEKSAALHSDLLKSMEPVEERIRKLLGVVSDAEERRFKMMALVNTLFFMRLGDEGEEELQAELARLKVADKLLTIEEGILERHRQQAAILKETTELRKTESVERNRREDERLSREQFVAALQDRLFAQRDANERKRLADLAVSARSVLNEKLSVLQSALSAVAAGPRGVIGALTAGAFRGQTNIAAPDLRTGKTEDVQRDKRRNSILESIEKVLQQIKTQATGGLAQ